MAPRKPKPEPFTFEHDGKTYMLPPFDPDKRVWALRDETLPQFDAKKMLLLPSHADRQEYKAELDAAETEALYAALIQTVGAHVASDSPEFDSLWSMAFTDHEFDLFVDTINKWMGEHYPVGESSGSQES